MNRPYRIGEVGIKYCHPEAGRRESPISIEFLNCKVN
ncbi:hypothetical protein SYO3AOP1_0512 [Sulfurihydrogenibium sp. YO3AOP1]|nr:hypothetical protein SYO3AOP1_0512 [Sulfurihydrogenibium sp. YO3AOP1]